MNSQFKCGSSLDLTLSLIRLFSLLCVCVCGFVNVCLFSSCQMRFLLIGKTKRYTTDTISFRRLLCMHLNGFAFIAMWLCWLCCYYRRCTVVIIFNLYTMSMKHRSYLRDIPAKPTKTMNSCMRVSVCPPARSPARLPAGRSVDLSSL